MYIQSCLVLTAIMAMPMVVYYLNLDTESADCRGSGSLTSHSVPYTTGPRAVPTLQFVIIVTRHGSRGPLFTYPESPYQSNDLGVWPYGVGELTQLGRTQMYQLGQRIRSMYNGFLSLQYRPGDFRSLSTPMERSLLSAGTFLAGLFPPSGFQEWNKHLPWQPVPVFLNHLDHNQIVPLSITKCPRYDKEKMKSFERFEEEYGPALNNLFDYVAPYTGYDNLTLRTADCVYKSTVLYTIWESLHVLKGEGLPLPAWSRGVYPEPLESLVVKMQRAVAIGSDTQIKFLEGELFQEMVGLMRSKANKTLSPDRRMYYYSGHDNTLIGLLAILGLKREDIGPIRTASALIYELHREHDSREVFIKILYIDGADPGMWPTDINIPDCHDPCDVHQLLDATEKYYNISDWERECQIL